MTRLSMLADTSISPSSPPPPFFSLFSTLVYSHPLSGPLSYFHPPISYIHSQCSSFPPSHHCLLPSALNFELIRQPYMLVFQSQCFCLFFKRY